ncbi:hypothetical protein D3C87_80290 [compost metagenome]
MQNVKTDNLTQLLTEIREIAIKYNLSKSKSNIQEMIQNIINLSNDIMSNRQHFLAKEIAKALEFIRKDMFSLHGKIGFNDYKKFVMLFDQIDAYIVYFNLEVE